MSRFMNSSVLSNIVDLSSEKVRFSTENFIVEKEYDGNYADLTSKEELRILEELEKKPWRSVIAAEFAQTSPWLYQIIVDRGRSLFLDLLSLPKDGVFLDVGSGWGQISLPLNKYGNVIALDLTANRLNLLQAIAQQEQVSLSYAQGNFLTFPFKQNVFDLIIFNGSFEWLGIGREEGKRIQEVQLEALCRARDLLKPEGQIYIGIENSLGLKYLLGAPDDHSGIKYISFLPEILAQRSYCPNQEDQILPAKTWSLTEYRQLITQAGLEEDKIYGCFPDYKLIRYMIDLKEINEYLMQRGLQVPEHNGINGSLFEHETELDALYRLLAKNGIVQYFCPSYGMILRKRR